MNMGESECVGIGDIQMSDLMNMTDSKALAMFKNRFKAFRTLADKIGEDAAFEKMMQGYPEQQKAFMGAFIDHTTMAAGFNEAKPVFRLMGFEMDVLDVSQGDTDAVLEIQHVCPVLSIYRDYGLSSPCLVLCEMEQEAVRRAYPQMKAAILSSKAKGDCVCVFKYERPAAVRVARPSVQRTRLQDLLKILPKFIKIGINVFAARLGKKT
ncbi:L-2-amino-thiazoline-4-carboxylic acid hydrolase [Gloeobacter kilaueensis]|uniref:L-2-amino-thiazoline-4-carboxylic acid hydrolase n=1 Tax=Gloeobacter kilaueensis (strain ATCC BAA-2537 / CCAP 1431/1 / ULC 316 / JS1) TaxID=1183438 RepID=U5QLX5_GLOK1|nr:L-2-amino-thiazoline-4-carboxylic acid hydrolase [Gloeobacter kilaueensis]AGY59863.1 hypothetical protein GKIL_3617 [Gloeobacter kilaueensis JS1]